ncbi:MAG: hypothetical protein AB8B55_20115 [Mariniblastus sp.]
MQKQNFGKRGFREFPIKLTILILIVGFVSGCIHETSANPFSEVVRAQSCDCQSMGQSQMCNQCAANCPTDCADELTGTEGKFEREVTGEQIFLMNCASCHEGRSLMERPLGATVVSFSHARKHAYLTGVEYRKLVNFLRNWHGLGAQY